jgi:glycosyltransferase involved in cell wall biosynthesis
MTSQPLVSVITPVYNGDAYLRECIESVLHQTWENFEYIIVDNCSSDDSLAIAREYAAQDSRIRVCTPKDFVSADANANRALLLIDPRSTYVKFVHADDWLYPNCIAEMVQLADANPEVGIVSAQRLVGTRMNLTGLPPDVTVLPGRDVARSSLLGGPLPYLFGSPTSLLLRADLVRARPEFFSLDNPHQSDQEACVDLLRESDLGFVHEALTFTRRHDASESAFFMRVGAEFPCALRLVLKHGDAFLSEAERKRKLTVRLAEYARFLLKHPMRLRNREFREYHRGELRHLLPQVRARDVAAGLLRQIAWGWRRARSDNGPSTG